MKTTITTSSGICPASACLRGNSAIGAVVRGDDAEHVADDDGDDLDDGDGRRRDAARTTASLRGDAEVVRAGLERVGEPGDASAAPPIRKYE